MGFSNLKNKLLIVLCVLVVFLPFYLITPVLADTEDVEFTTISGLTATNSRNYFYSTASGLIGVVDIEKGYIYHFTKEFGSADVVIVSSSSYPQSNVEYEILTSIGTGNTYDFLATTDTTLYISFNTYQNNDNDYSFTVTREKIENMDGAVDGLVQNVGIQSLWNTFNDANPFILVVVLFSFGLFIIIALVRKLRKGKGGF